MPAREQTAVPWSLPEFTPEEGPEPVFSGLAEGWGPTFTVSEAAKVFFARSPYWLRWLENQQVLTDEDGEPVIPRVKGVRLYTLADVEKIAYLLASKGKIDFTQLVLAASVLRAVGLTWGLLDKEVRLVEAAKTYKPPAPKRGKRKEAPDGAEGKTE